MKPKSFSKKKNLQQLHHWYSSNFTQFFQATFNIMLKDFYITFTFLFDLDSFYAIFVLHSPQEDVFLVSNTSTSAICLFQITLLYVWMWRDSNQLYSKYLQFFMTFQELQCRFPILLIVLDKTYKRHSVFVGSVTFGSSDGCNSSYCVNISLMFSELLLLHFLYISKDNVNHKQNIYRI